MFVGDYFVNILNIYAFWLILPILFIFNIRVYKASVLRSIVFMAFSAIPLIAAPFKDIELAYYQSFIFGFFVLLSFASVADVFKQNNYLAIFASLCIILIILFQTSHQSLESARFSFVFGPTILYRVVLILYFTICIFALKNEKYLIFLFLTVITVIIIVRIGSRGGIVTIVVMSMFVLGRYVNIYIFAQIIIALFLAFLFIYNCDQQFNQIFDNLFSSLRAFNFDSDGASIAIRLEKASSIFDLLNSPQVAFGSVDPNGFTGNYPHNIFVEVIIYHGIFEFLLFAFMHIGYLRVIFMPKKYSENDWYIAMLFMPIMIGSQFSGSLLDNYSYLSVLTCFMICQNGDLGIFGSRRVRRIF